MNHRFRKQSHSSKDRSHDAMNDSTSAQSHTLMNTSPLSARRLSFYETSNNDSNNNNNTLDECADKEGDFSCSLPEQYLRQQQQPQQRSKSYSFQSTTTSSTIMEETNYNINLTSTNNNHNNHRVVFSEGTLQGSPTNTRRHLHTVLWFITSALSAVVTKRLMTTYPYPLSIAAVVLSFQSVYSVLTWIVPTTRSNNGTFPSSRNSLRMSNCSTTSTTAKATTTKTLTGTTAPPWHSLKQRHYQRLLPVVLCHGLGTILSYAAVPYGPSSTLVLLRMITSTTNINMLLQPLFQTSRNSNNKNTNSGANNNSVLSPLLVLSCSMMGLYLIQSPLLQVFFGITTNIAFWGRSQFRIPTRRYRGGQNVFSMTCILSLCLVVMPLMIFWEGCPSPLHFILIINSILTRSTSTSTNTTTLTLDQGISLVLLGVLYCINNEYCFSPCIITSSSTIHLETIRRFITFITCFYVFGEFPSIAKTSTIEGNNHDYPRTTYHYYIVGTILLIGAKIYTTRFLASKTAGDISNFNNNNNNTKRRSYSLTSTTRDRATSNDSMSTVTSLNSILRNC